MKQTSRAQRCQALERKQQLRLNTLGVSHRFQTKCGSGKQEKSSGLSCKTGTIISWNAGSH